MKTKAEIKQFILDTLLEYRQDPSKKALEKGSCKYLTEDGRKCAVGKWMKEGIWQTFKGDFGFLISSHNPEDFFKKEALDMDFGIGGWTLIQKYHDNYNPCNKYDVNNTVLRIEQYFNIELPELKL